MMERNFDAHITTLHAAEKAFADGEMLKAFGLFRLSERLAPDHQCMSHAAWRKNTARESFAAPMRYRQAYDVKFERESLAPETTGCFSVFSWSRHNVKLGGARISGEVPKTDDEDQFLGFINEIPNVEYDDGWNHSYHDADYAAPMVIATGKTALEAREAFKRAISWFNEKKQKPKVDPAVARFNARWQVRFGD